MSIQIRKESTSSIWLSPLNSIPKSDTDERRVIVYWRGLGVNVGDSEIVTHYATLYVG